MAKNWISIASGSNVFHDTAGCQERREKLAEGDHEGLDGIYSPDGGSSAIRRTVDRAGLTRLVQPGSSHSD